MSPLPGLLLFRMSGGTVRSAHESTPTIPRDVGPNFYGFCRICARGNFSKSGLCATRVRKMTAKAMAKIAAAQRAELYYETHPGSPSAVRCPKLFIRSGVWIALLGRSVRDGIAGFGPTVEAALRAFDDQYLKTLHPPCEQATLDRAA
jgi:hypothetical protein